MFIYIYCSLAVIAYIVGCIYYIKKILPSRIADIKCRKVKNCKKEDCSLRPYCKHTAYTEEELRAIREMIESL